MNNYSTIKIMYCMYNNNNNAVKIENGANQGATYLVGIQSSLNVKSQGGLSFQVDLSEVILTV